MARSLAWAIFDGRRPSSPNPIDGVRTDGKAPLTEDFLLKLRHAGTIGFDELQDLRVELLGPDGTLLDGSNIGLYFGDPHAEWGPPIPDLIDRPGAEGNPPLPQNFLLDVRNGAVRVAFDESQNFRSDLSLSCSCRRAGKDHS